MQTFLISCATCIADNAAAQKAFNMGIWVLLGALGTVLLGIASVVFAFYRRQRRLSAGLVISPSF
jgi:hypothetical protein